MIILMVISVVLGWLAGVWIPYYGIFSILILFSILAYRGHFDGGLEAIPASICCCVFSWTMIIIGFITGNVYLSDITSFLVVLFTGG